MDVNSDWKKKVGFPINYNSGQSSEDDFDNEVVYRKQQTARLLADGGDGSEADLLGTTPPRTVLRTKAKERYRKFRSGNTEQVQLRHNRRSIEDGAVAESLQDRGRKRLSHRMRALDRESKGQGRADSLPAPAQDASALVESSNRFMCLSSRLKTPRAPPTGAGPPTPPLRDPPSRESFYQTFSILINMGNIEKGCRRTISREEQVWQSSLKDMIWLELQAAVAGRTLAQQDAYLCTLRAAVPQQLQTIRDYRFVHPNPCKGTSRLCAREAREEIPEDDGDCRCSDEGSFGCLSFNCQQCTDAVGKALREVGALLEAFYAAEALYPSSKAMQEEHPIIASVAFQSRLKAMCLWYNSALHMRLKILAIRRMLHTMRAKRRDGPAPDTDSDLSRQSSECRPCQVRFSTPPVSNTPTDSNNSDSSALSDFKHEDADQGNHIRQRNESQGNEDQGHLNSVEHRDHNTQDGPGREGHSRRQRNESTNDHGNEKSEFAQKVQENDNVLNNQEIKEDKNLRLAVQDGVDSGDRKRDGTDQTTPEIIISDSKYGPTDTQTSCESGYSTSFEADGWNDVYNLGCLDDITGLRLLNKCSVSPLRVHHREMLKTMGVRRVMMFMSKLRANLLGKVHLTLEKPDTLNVKDENLESPTEVFDDTIDDEEKADIENKQRAYELRRYGCWSEESLAMGLPSYRSHFLLLSSIGMEGVHDYLSLRLEHTPTEPSCLTAKQLLHDMKEGLDIATEMRASFSSHVEAALIGLKAAAPARADLLRIVHTFDSTIETVFKQYLTYLRAVCAVEHMGRCGLQAEWTFAARLAKRLACAAKLAPLTFADIACIQLDRVHKQFEDKFQQIAETTGKMPDPDRHIVYALCREAQSLYASERDATLQCAQWARALAARLRRAPGNAFRVQRANILDALMRVRDCIVSHAKFIAERSAEARDEAALPRIRELLLQLYKLGFELHRELYKLAVVPTLPNETSQRRPISLQPARAKKEIGARRPDTVILHDFDPLVHKELHRFINDGPRPTGPKTSPPNVRNRPKFSRSESINEEGEACVFDERIFDSFGGQTQTSIEILLSGGTIREIESNSHDPVELRSEERVSEEEREWAMRVSRAIVEFARCWMAFVVERCDEGRGLRPRWASQGLEFLMLACEPCNTKHLTDQEFEDLKQAMDGCISHVVGKPVPKTPDEGLTASDTTRRRRPSPKSIPGGVGLGIDIPAGEIDPLVDFKGLHTSEHSIRVVQAIHRLDSSRDEKLQQMQAVGRVLDAVVPSYEPKLRQVKFKWQRGLKIGAGTFGKVYTVVNTESGQLLAMKELSIGAGDRRALQRAANELRVLEGVIHPHLVRYYGCELHREEMLIFMELCVEGSLEALVATTGALEEPMVRRYTKQLVSAVIALHTRNIAHRDIKSGNIFLTNEGHCLKLGDFGCAVKIRANTTAAGELQGCVGTQAYMAPEVFMKSSGHGRAADIWSLGCVVTEMASGKRPFPEYDSNYQIMFVVGMGGGPTIPESLSEEGRQFTRACLTHEPDARPKASDLAHHHFLMIKSDEDCKCEPGFLIS